MFRTTVRLSVVGIALRGLAVALSAAQPAAETPLERPRPRGRGCN